MKYIIVVIILLIVHLQYRLWVGDGSVAQIKEYQARLDVLKQKAKEKKERNEALYAEIQDLRKGEEAIEERARDEFGMVKENETFFQVIEEK
jgi:cell division protein FtsB